jgi:hypothetical protein
MDLHLEESIGAEKTSILDSADFMSFFFAFIFRYGKRVGRINCLAISEIKKVHGIITVWTLSGHVWNKPIHMEWRGKWTDFPVIPPNPYGLKGILVYPNKPLLTIHYNSGQQFIPFQIHSIAQCLDVAIGSEVIFPEKIYIIKDNKTQKNSYEQVEFSITSVNI